MTERKFTRGLIKAGTAAQLRETVSQVVRESSILVSANSPFSRTTECYLKHFMNECGGGRLLINRNRNVIQAELVGLL